jgi:phage internal scaffolding protein
MNIRSAYSKKERVQIGNFEQTLTRQDMKDECDINVILGNYRKTGSLANIRVLQPSYGVVPVTTYQEALNTLIEAEEGFLELPSKVRAKFGNDPAKFLDFATDPKNLEKMREYGLANPEKLNDIINVNVVSDSTKDGSGDEPVIKPDK